MARLPIIVAPDPRLKRKSEPVAHVDDEIRKLMSDMLETVYRAPGIGLAAIQVGVPKRVLVVDVSDKDGPRAPYKMADPELTHISDDLVTQEEGCLSFPDHYVDVRRPRVITVRYLDENDTWRELRAEGLLATCIQHEIDHLDGVLFVDHVSTIRRDMILRKLTKARRAKDLESV